jgi:hypothetical protein
MQATRRHQTFIEAGEEVLGRAKEVGQAIEAQVRSLLQGLGKA